jgi:Putative amidase domain
MLLSSVPEHRNALVSAADPAGARTLRPIRGAGRALSGGLTPSGARARRSRPEGRSRPNGVRGYAASWVNAQDQSVFLLQYLPGVTKVASYYGLDQEQLQPTHAGQGDVVLYDWNNDGVFDHEAILTASDGTNPDGSTNWDLVDAHTSNRYHAYWTLAQYNASWATTRIVVLHIAPTTS